MLLIGLTTVDSWKIRVNVVQCARVKCVKLTFSGCRLLLGVHINGVSALSDLYKG